MIAGAGGRCAETLFLHRFSQLVVFDVLSGAFHRAEQRRFREPRRRTGIDAFVSAFSTRTVSPGFTGTRLGASFELSSWLPSLDTAPSRADEDFALALETVAFGHRDARRDQVFRRGKKMARNRRVTRS